MPSAYTPIFKQINESRVRRGLKPMTWAGFLGKNCKEIWREKIRIQDYIEPDPPKNIKRPPAEYSNTSAVTRAKYGL